MLSRWQGLSPFLVWDGGGLVQESELDLFFAAPGANCFRTYTGPRTKDLLVQIATEEDSVDDCLEEDTIEGL